MTKTTQCLLPALATPDTCYRASMMVIADFSVGMAELQTRTFEGRMVSHRGVQVPSRHQQECGRRFEESGRRFCMHNA